MKLQKYRILRNSIQLSILAIFVSGLSGCATIRGIVCGCEREQDYCTCECSGVIEATCAAPEATCSAPRMLNSTPMEYPMSPPPMMEMSLPPVSGSSMDPMRSTALPPGAQPSSEHWAPKGTTFHPHSESAVGPKSCDVELKAAQKRFDAKLAELESRFETEHESKQDVSQALESVNDEVARLSSEVEYWQTQVRRLDRTATEQHQSDMASLDTISKMIGGISEGSQAPAESSDGN